MLLTQAITAVNAVTMSSPENSSSIVSDDDRRAVDQHEGEHALHARAG